MAVMTKFLVSILAAGVLVAVGHSLGHHDAHQEVARECERLGGFYVGKTVYECKVKER
jgi:hypothetical protein